MRKDILQKAILLPLITALVIGAVFFVVMKGSERKLVPFSDGSVIAYHSETEEETAGEINGIPMRYDADYASLINMAGIHSGSASFDETGCVYLQILNTNADKLGDTVTVTLPDGKSYRYTYAYELTAPDEQQALMTAPAAAKSLVVYFHPSEGVGLASQYQILVYEEAM